MLYTGHITLSIFQSVMTAKACRIRQMIRHLRGSDAHVISFKPIRHIAVAAVVIVNTWLTTCADAKIPGAVHCYNDICHRIRTIEETQSRIGIVEPLVASFYDSPEHDRFNPRLETSSGAQFEADADDNAASPIHPDGTILLIWSPGTRAAAVVRINNAGPYYPGRTLDVSHGVAQRLGFDHHGVMHLLTAVIAAPTSPESRYIRGRVYPKVSGYLGRFENIALAALSSPLLVTALELTGSSMSSVNAVSQQLAMRIAEDYIQLGELALSFRAAPSDIMSPEEATGEPFAVVPETDAPAALPANQRTGMLECVGVKCARQTSAGWIMPPDSDASWPRRLSVAVR